MRIKKIHGYSLFFSPIFSSRIYGKPSPCKQPCPLMHSRGPLPRIRHTDTTGRPLFCERHPNRVKCAGVNFGHDPDRVRGKVWNRTPRRRCVDTDRSFRSGPSAVIHNFILYPPHTTILLHFAKPGVQQINICVYYVKIRVLLYDRWIYNINLQYILLFENNF